MATVDMLLDALRYAIRDASWGGSGFELKQAYACALCSELAYQHIPEFERLSFDRARIIPCYEYQINIQQQNFPNIVDATRRFEEEIVIRIVETGGLVVLLIKTPEIILVSLRGTQSLYDALLDIYTFKYKVETLARSYKFHAGFWSAARDVAPRISQEIDDLAGGDHRVPVYVTGHSLGGAAAAILNSAFNSRAEISPGFWREKYQTDFRDAYTFGMPRYGTGNVVHELKTPHHLRNEGDIVPSVPFSFLGYESVSTEFDLNGGAYIGFLDYDEIEREIFEIQIESKSIISYHSIELYRRKIGGNINAHLF